MAAYIVKPADHSAFIPDNDQALARDVRGKIITGLRDLTLVPDQHPFRRENRLLFLRKNLRGDEIELRQALGTSRERLNRLAKFWRYVRLHRWHLGNALRRLRPRQRSYHTRTARRSLRSRRDGPFSVNTAWQLPQDHLVKLVPVVQVVEINRVFRSNGVIRDFGRTQHALARFVIVNITAHRGVVFFNRGLIE